MARIQFCGPTYASQSPNVDAERCVNLIPEQVEAPGGKSAYALYSSPGTAIAYNIGATAILGLFSCQPNGSTTDRLFAVVQSGINQQLWELFQDGTKIARGNLLAPVSPVVTMAHNGTQLAICTGGQIWILTLATNVLTGPVGGLNNIALLDYSDGFFIALQQNSNKFQVSALLDGTTWPGLGVGQVSEFPDNVISMKVNQRGIWFQGRKASVPYYNAGAINVPFLPVNGVFIEGGAGAVFGTAKLDNSLFWIDQSERGGLVARRANGYTPQRISNHGVEAVWNTYPQFSDVISYAYADQGHEFYHVYFPSGKSVDGIPGAGASWRYDVATQMWHEVAFWNAQQGHYEAHHSQNHAFAWGKHFVGDWRNGTVYQMAIPSRNGTAWQFADDAGNPIRRMRRGPTVSTENKFFDIPQIEFDLEVGLGPQPPLTGGAPPTIVTLVDSLGKFWSVDADDNGNLHAFAAQAGTPANAALILNDPTNAASWQITVNTQGLLVATQVPLGSYATFLPMTSNSGKNLWALQVTSHGALELIAKGATARGPQLMFRWSRDHTHTWNDYRQLDCGQAGEFRKRVIYRRLGRMRAFTPEVVWTEPVPLRLIEAYIPPAQERLAKQYAKVT